MDVFSHGLWSSVLAQAANKKKKERRFNPWLAAWWGVFPDVFAFAIIFWWTLWQKLFGSGASFDPREVEPAVRSTQGVFELTPFLYQLSHSLVIFILVFGAIYTVQRLRARYRGKATRVPWEMLAWLLHIFCDIPTHSYKFYPTPFLWPLSDIRFNGFSWGEWWFILLNYSALIIVFLLVKKKRAEKYPTKNED
ncbi:MAG TPA: metal-dependent hydrolase [Patescibacteria group bacterium]|nr:metal-dependent hydrolase [Patescibacteria group bacterium]